MPFPESGPRKPIHLRQIYMRGYERPDGLFEVEGRVSDIKDDPFTPDATVNEIPPGEFVHDMWIRLVVDADLLIHDIIAVTDSSPYRQCPEAAGTLARLKGERIAAGWSVAVKRALRGAQGCTHLMELLIPLATAAYQTTTVRRFAKGVKNDSSGKPIKIDTCYAMGSDREQVMLRWPKYYTGPLLPAGSASEKT